MKDLIPRLRDQPDVPDKLHYYLLVLERSSDEFKSKIKARRKELCCRVSKPTDPVMSDEEIDLEFALTKKIDKEQLLKDLFDYFFIPYNEEAKERMYYYFFNNKFFRPYSVVYIKDASVRNKKTRTIVNPSIAVIISEHVSKEEWDQIWWNNIAPGNKNSERPYGGDIDFLKRDHKKVNRQYTFDEKLLVYRMTLEGNSNRKIADHITKLRKEKGASESLVIGENEIVKMNCRMKELIEPLYQ